MKKLLLLILIMLICSCNKDWLDVKSEAKLSVPSSLADFQGLLDDALYMNTIESPKGEIASDGHYVSDINFTSAEDNDLKDIYRWSKTMRHTADDGYSWANSYKKILYCNIILDGLKKITPTNSIEQVQFKNIEGQALFQRSYEYFSLAQLYTPVLTPENKNSEFGVFLRLTSDITLPSKRVTIKETYDQIISDLKLAAELLPNKPKILTRGSKAAVYALLSRIYLYLGQYEESLDYTEKSLQISSELLDFNAISIGKGYIGLYNKEVVFHTSLSYSAFTTQNCLIDTSLVKSYHADDLRLSAFFIKNQDSTYSFQGNYNNMPYPLFNGLATDELYLTKAECQARIGNLSAAANTINIFLKTRWNNNVAFQPFSFSNAEDALGTILEERNKSLLLRGIRWMDLRRLNLETKFRKTLTRNVENDSYTLTPNSYKYAFPIPDDIVDQTRAKQNPGWQ